MSHEMSETAGPACQGTQRTQLFFEWQARKQLVKHRRIIVTHYGGPDELRVVEEECPEPKDGEVRVKVLAAGVSLPDVLMREGIHPETPRLPFTPGWDLVGVVDRAGDGVSGIEPGEFVAALPICGAYAEFVCLPRRELVPVPSGLEAAEAVSLVLNYVTAFQMLHRSAKVRPGQRVLIHGASGGVGSALLQLGTLFDLLQQQKIKPLIAQRFPLAEARQAHELLGKGGVTGKIVLVCNGSSLESGAT